MAFTRFPTPKIPNGKVGAPFPSKKCTGKLRSWDCGCAWGCPLCSVRFACDKCQRKAK